MTKLIDIKTGKTKELKNLGWLIRHASEVYNIAIWPQTSFEEPETDCDCRILFNLDDGRVFVSNFASLSIARQWVKRRCLSHAKIQDYCSR